MKSNCFESFIGYIIYLNISGEYVVMATVQCSFACLNILQKEYIHQQDGAPARFSTTLEATGPTNVQTNVMQGVAQVFGPHALLISPLAFFVRPHLIEDMDYNHSFNRRYQSTKGLKYGI